MTDEASSTIETDAANPPEGKPHEESVSYERFQQTNKKAREASDRAKTLEKEMADLRSEMEQREQAGLPELERERKRAEQLEKRIADAEARADAAEQRVQRNERERWISAAAQAQNFTDPADAAAFLNLDDIEDEKDAERAVKRLAASKKHLLKAEDPVLPGRVLENGRQPTTDKTPGGFDLASEASMLAEGLKQFASKG